MTSTATSALIAMHRSPAEPNPAFTAASAARSRSASGSTTMWFFAPPRACTRLPLRVPVSYTYRAIGVDPTNEIAFTRGSSSSASTATLSPCSTLNTPSGRPASFHSAPSQFAVDGSFSLGLRITQLPAAIAIGKNHIGTMAGKLNGEMTPTTPSGCRSEETSTLVEAFSVRLPLSRCASPQANSTTSWPRVTSPSASESTLPCSLVISSAASCLRSLSSSRNRNSTCVRRASDMSRHAGQASAAAAITASASSGEASASCLVTRPVAGSNTSEVRVTLARERRAALPVRNRLQLAGRGVGVGAGQSLWIGDGGHGAGSLPESARINVAGADEVVDCCHCSHISVQR